jgi:hypothetical protein
MIRCLTMGQQVAVWGYLTEGLVESGKELCEQDMQLLNPKLCTFSASQLEVDGIRAGGFGFAMLKSGEYKCSRATRQTLMLQIYMVPS